MPEFPSAIGYRDINRTHPEYNPAYWGRIRALYRGGQDLLRPETLKTVFPRHAYESTTMYTQRCAMAFYVNYAGEIIDHIVSALFMHPVEVSTEGSVDPFYQAFNENTAYRGGKALPLQSLVRQQVLNALLYRTSWTLVDLPPQIEAYGEDISEATQRISGALDAYALPLDNRTVTDWDEDPSGALLWVKTKTVSEEKTFSGVAGMITENYTIYTRDSWARYAITYAKNNPPNDDTPVPIVEAGPHSFGRVPLLRLELPHGLWAMNKLESIAREHMNKRCALAWAEYKTLYPVLYEFEQGDDGACLSGAGDDAGRFTGQTRGIGYVQIRAEKDRVEYVGPDSAPFATALASVKDLRDEMHRVTHQMALSFDNHALALRRSGESKAQDKQDSTVVLDALGQMARMHTEEIIGAISTGRGDVIEWAVNGLDEYDNQDPASAIKEAADLAAVSIQSETFQKVHSFQTAKSVLAGRVPVGVLKQIKSEIEASKPGMEAQDDEQTGHTNDGDTGK